MKEVLLKCDLSDLTKAPISYVCSFRNENYTVVCINEEDYKWLKFLDMIWVEDTEHDIPQYYLVGYGTIKNKNLKLLLNPEGRVPEPNEYIFSAMDYEPTEIKYSNFAEYLADEIYADNDPYEQAQVIYCLSKVNQMSIGYLLWSII